MTPQAYVDYNIVTTGLTFPSFMPASGTLRNDMHEANYLHDADCNVGTMKFSVTFTPSNLGVRNAVLRIGALGGFVDIFVTGGSLLAWLFVGLLLTLSQALECLVYALSIHTASTAASRPTPSSAEIHGRPIISMCLAILVRLVSIFSFFLLVLTESDE